MDLQKNDVKDEAKRQIKTPLKPAFNLFPMSKCKCIFEAVPQDIPQIYLLILSLEFYQYCLNGVSCLSSHLIARFGHNVQMETISNRRSTENSL